MIRSIGEQISSKKKTLPAVGFAKESRGNFVEELQGINAFI